MRARRSHVAGILAILALGGTACSGTAVPGAPPPGPPGPAPAPAPAPQPDAPPPAPWSAASIGASDVAPIYVAEWRKAENRPRCALLAPPAADADVGARATARAATFGGGWGVAYDVPEQRSAFGVAGTGASAWSGDIYDAWPERREYADGSRVGYGPEGGTGPNWLAYVRIPGQDCLYNVWSRLGQAHLESLLARLRFVAVDATGDRETAAPAPWYVGGRALDLTGDGRADSVHLEAVGARLDSLRVTLALIVDGEVKHREEWGSSYEFALTDAAVRDGPGAGAYLRAQLDSVLASVRLERLDAPGVQVMAEDSTILAGIEPRPTHRVSFAYGYETTVRLAWDAARGRFVRLWSCC